MVSSAPLLAVIGAGPAGLMAAEAAVRGGAEVHVFDAMPSAGRKFLMAGKSGLNLTHAEAFDRFLSRFGPARERLEPILRGFTPDELRNWAEEQGVKTFIGSSGRVFPEDFKAAPLLRGWLRRLRGEGVRFHMRHRWIGWADDGSLCFETPDGPAQFKADAVILALGGASWPLLGADGSWVPVMRREGVAVAPLLPANCGFDAAWSEHFRQRFAGMPVKSVVLSTDLERNRGEFAERNRGEFVITGTGIEGSAVYVHSPVLRDRIAAEGHAVLTLDLMPDRDRSWVEGALSRPRGSRSLADHLRRHCGITGVKAGLLRECLSAEIFADPGALAGAIKALPLRLVAPRPLAEAISSAGGLAFSELDERLMLRRRPGVFCAGEMLDWEVRTGGYLLTACFALGRAAGLGAVAWMRGDSGAIRPE